MTWWQPFDPRAELIWIGASVTGPDAKPLELLGVLDYGTPQTIIERSIAEAIGFSEDQKIGDAVFRGVAGPPVRGYRVIASEFKAFGRSIKDFEIICLELTEDLEVEGLIGLDFLRGLKVTTDFREGLITLE